MKSKKADLRATESGMMVARSWGWGRWGDVGQSVQSFTYKKSKL